MIRLALIFAALTLFSLHSCTVDPLTAQIDDWVEENANDPDSWEPISNEVVNTLTVNSGETVNVVHHHCRISNDRGGLERTKIVFPDQ
jgi:hypothetical protein